MAARILIVEDEAIVRKNFCYVLRNEGYEVHEASSGVQALGLINEHQFDLVVTDLVMPEMDGLKLVERVQAQSPQTRIILLTAFFSSKSTDPISPAGIEILIKPVELDVLVSTVKRLLRANAN